MPSDDLMTLSATSFGETESQMTSREQMRKPIAIDVEDLTVSYGPVPALLDVSLKVPAGKLVGVIGPNGSGKSTLIKSILGFVKPDVGHVKIFGKDFTSTKGLVAYVPQRGAVDWDFPITAREVAAMGRYGHRSWWQNLTREDFRIADEALDKSSHVRVWEAADRSTVWRSAAKSFPGPCIGSGRGNLDARRTVCWRGRGN